MSEQIREQISAFLDGELPDSETELLLKRMSRDEDLRQCFGRYALIAEVVRDPKSRPMPADFTQRVNRLIDGEPALEVKEIKSSAVRQWWRPLAGAAVAAGVAAVAVVSLERRSDVPALVATANAPRNGSLTQAMPANAPLLASSRKEAVSYTVPAANQQGPAVLPAARLTNYVFAHSKYSSALGQRNVLSGLIAEQPESEQKTETAPAPVLLPSHP